jgi:outer membrane receptor for monomeric catechols
MITPRPGDTDSVDVVLTAVATALPSVVAMAQHDSMSHKLLAEFWDRRAKGFGKFITRDDIVQRGAIQFVDLIRTVPGAMVQSSRGRQEIRFSRSVIRDCPPQYWVDGIPIEHGSAEEFTPDNVEAIEMYSGPSSTPPQFVTRAMTCGTIVIWSRLPG